MKYAEWSANDDGWSDWAAVPWRSGFHQMCCDCGLVHVWQFRLRDKKLEIRVRRDDRATAGARRGKDYRGLRVPRGR